MPGRDAADLRGRRNDLAATIEMMAADTGMDADDIREVEEGKATDQRLDHYAEWLARLEAWPPGDGPRNCPRRAAAGGSGHDRWARVRPERVMHLLEQGKGEV
jgi:hypothetical protein